MSEVVNAAPQPDAIPYRILVIDDNAAIHEDFRKVLCPAAAPVSDQVADLEAALFGDAAAAAPADGGAATFELDAASQGEEGLAKLQAARAEGRPYAMAFVDMRMPPGWDGVRTIRELWKIDPKFQVVICTAYSDYSPAQIAAELKMDGRMMILRKPFDGMEIRQLATSMCERWQLNRRRADLERIVETRTAELKRQALHDALTGLPNRVLFNDRLAAVLHRCRRHGTNAAVLFVDADGFKTVNDSLGHEAGDALLLQLADRLKGSLRETDTAARVPPPASDASSTGDDTLAARLGGDEFAIILDGIASDSDAARVAQRLVARAAEPYVIKGQRVHASVSVGITTSSVGYERAEDMVRDADTAMYQAKRAGRGRFVMFDPKMHAEAVARLNFEADLRAAIEAGQLRVHYQPIFELGASQQIGGQRLVGFEALARWEHPTRGTVPPAEFIPLAEETGTIVPLGRNVLEQACRQLSEWQRRWPELRDLTMSVNVSQRQLIGNDFADALARIIQETGVAPANLKIEITESAVMSDAKKTMLALSRVQEMDVKVHIDDFGSGYSSLSCLQSLPLDGMKIDRDFVRDITTRPDQAAVVRSVVGLAHSLTMPLVAEGIETPEQQAMLRAMGCDHAQGYLYARPMDAAAATAFIGQSLSGGRNAA